MEISRFGVKGLLKAGWKHFPSFTEGRREGEGSLRFTADGDSPVTGRPAVSSANRFEKVAVLVGGGEQNFSR